MRDLLLDLDPALGRRDGLEQALREAIRSGRLAPGAALPSTRGLAADQGLSRSTVVAAYEQLAVEGYLVVRQGAATVVADAGPQSRPSSRRSSSPVDPDKNLGAGPAGAGRRGPAAGGGVVDLRPGEPDPGLFPRAAWLRSLRRVVGNGPDDLFRYGDLRGHPALRRSLGEYLARSRAVSATETQVGVFNGATAAVGLLGELLVRRGVTAVAIEEPGPFLLRQVLALAGLQVVPVPVDNQGLRVDCLAEAGAEIGAVVVTPANQYPTGVTLSPARRTELLGLAASTGALVIEDDYDGEFRYDRTTIGSLQGRDPDRVIYLGTASKSLAPALRLAWTVVPEFLLGELATVKHLRGGPSNVDQAALADFMDRGELDRHLRTARRHYRRRHRAITDLVAETAPWAILPDVSAGLHLCLELGAQAGVPDEAEALAIGAKRSVRLLGLGPHWTGPAATEGLVIGFTRPAEHRFAEALDRLGGLLRELGDRPGP